MARYNNELFSAPTAVFADSHEGESFGFDGKADKVYRYGPTREVLVEVFNGQGVRVTYEPTVRIVEWKWSDRNAAFEWAKDRSAHMRALGWH